MSILYCAHFYEGANAYSRYYDLCRYSSDQIILFNFNSFFPQWKRTSSSLIWSRLYFGPPYKKLSESFIEAFNQNQPDIIFFEKNLYLSPHILDYVTHKSRLIHFYHDNCQLPRNSSPQFIASLPFYDYIFTTKAVNLEYYRSFNSNTFLIDNSISSKDLFYAPSASPHKLYDVCFVGRWEPSREKFFIKLIQDNPSTSFVISGPRWHSRKYVFNNLRNCSVLDSVWGLDYQKLISQSIFSLNLFATSTLDSQTTRLIEIPCYQSILLTENSTDISNLFPNCKDDMIFSDVFSLSRLLKRLLASPEGQHSLQKAQIEDLRKLNLSWYEQLFCRYNHIFACI